SEHSPRLPTCPCATRSALRALCHPPWRLDATAYLFLLFHEPAPGGICTLSLHDALPIYPAAADQSRGDPTVSGDRHCRWHPGHGDRKSTRLNSSHVSISYAVFCVKKKSKAGQEPCNRAGTPRWRRKAGARSG